MKTVLQADLTATALLPRGWARRSPASTRLDEVGHRLPAWLAAILILAAGQEGNRGRKPHSGGLRSFAMHTGHGIAPAPERAGKSPEPDRRPETSRAESQFQDPGKDGTTVSPPPPGNEMLRQSHGRHGRRYAAVRSGTAQPTAALNSLNGRRGPDASPCRTPPGPAPCPSTDPSGKYSPGDPH